MHLTSVSLSGVKGHSEAVTLDPVTLIVGPNGSGKTSVLGGIQYALTGRFPGVPGATAEDLQVLGSGHRGFDVSIRADNGVLVTRGLHGGKHNLTVDGTSERPKNKTETENLLSRTFGNVDLYADAFDVKRGMLHASDEKRKAWVSAVCSGAATTWTLERLAATVGPAWPSDWNPALDPSPLVCVELHLSRLDEALRSAREVVRDSQKVVDSIAAPLAVPTEEDVAAAVERLSRAHIASIAASAVQMDECPICGECSTQQLEEFAAQADMSAIAREDQEALAAFVEIIKQRVLGQEQAAHARAVDEAKVRVDDLKSLMLKLKETRMAILHDAVAPLRAELANLTMLTGSHEGPASVSLDGDTLAFTCRRGEHVIVPFEAMSAGEKLRLTLAVLVAVSRIRRQPWTGIFVDGFESVYPEQDRANVLADVVRAQRAGLIDNAVFAGAMPVPEPVEGVRVIERRGP